MDLPSLTAATKSDLSEGSYCVGFLNGFTGNLSSTKNSICTNGASMGATVRTYTDFMTEHPEFLEQDRRVGLRLALQSAYPCSAPQTPKWKDPANARPETI